MSSAARHQGHGTEWSVDVGFVAGCPFTVNPEKIEDWRPGVALIELITLIVGTFQTSISLPLTMGIDSTNSDALQRGKFAVNCVIFENVLGGIFKRLLNEIGLKYII